MPIPGATVDVVDEPDITGGLPTATDPAFLLTADTNGPATVTLITSPDQAATDFPSATTMLAELDGLMRESNGDSGMTQVYAVKIPTGLVGSTTFTATTASGQPTLSAVSSFTGVAVGDYVTGAGIPANTTILSMNSGAGTITMSANATATATGVTVTRGVGALAATLALLSVGFGPGQIVAPSVILAADQALIAQHAWQHNRIYLANAASGASDSTIIALADALVATGYGRNTAIFADWAVIPGVGASTRNVPWSLIVAGQIARNDRATGNPNLAAAGVQGIAQYALGIVAERTDTAMATLNASQVNVARRIGSGPPRTYGYRTLADLDLLPQWWDLSGSRTVMDLRAHAGADSEAVVFGQLDANRLLLDKWNGLVSKRCLELLKVGALFGTPADAFKVNTGPLLNPNSELKLGRIRLTLKVKTSPFAEVLGVTLARQPIT